mgnify:FL=1
MKTLTIINLIFLLAVSILGTILSVAAGSILGTIFALAICMPTAFAIHALMSL